MKSMWGLYFYNRVLTRSQYTVKLYNFELRRHSLGRDTCARRLATR